jgi:enoyl-CoA hydratase
MQFDTLLVHVQDAVATVTLNRPKVLNALNRLMIRELGEAFAALADDEAVRAVLITGAGDKAFAAGADIGELAAMDVAAATQIAESANRTFRRIETLGKPVIACIGGFALGGGCELAMACTLRLASTEARLGQPEIKLGLIPGFGGSQRLPRLVGHGAALRMMLTGDVIGAAEAFRIGLVDEVIPAEGLMQRANELAKQIAAMPRQAVAATIHAVGQGADLPLDEALALEAKLFGSLWTTDDRSEGTRAFLEKRAPKWTGR